MTVACKKCRSKSEAHQDKFYLNNINEPVKMENSILILV
jgi:hypothetical protein